MRLTFTKNGTETHLLAHTWFEARARLTGDGVDVDSLRCVAREDVVATSELVPVGERWREFRKGKR